MLEIVMGPARAGKGERGLDRFCRELGPGREGRAMWLVPHRNLARTLRRKVAERLGAVAEPKILTLDDLARWIFESAPSGLRLLSDLSRFLYLAEALEKSRDPHLEEAKKETGFVRGLGQTVDDLKEHLVWPAEGSPVFAREYDRMLKERRAVDRKSMVATAVRRLGKNGKFFQAIGVDLVLFYGFNSFSPLEWELVKAILKQVPGWVSLTADPARPELFAESLETARKLELLFPAAKKETAPAAASTAAARRLEFSNHDQELEWIAREIARLGREEKIAPDEIAVVSGAGGGSAWWARHVFRRYGLATQSFASEPMEAQPLLRGLFCEAETVKGGAKEIYEWGVGRLREQGVLENLLASGDDEAQTHFAALQQWGALLREMEGHPLFAKYGRGGWRHQRFTPPRLGAPAVHFYGAENPPLESYRVVFLAHLTETAFPRPSAFNLFGAAPLVDEERHRSAEKLAFYEMLTRAGEKLYLSHPRANFQGQAELPSLFLKDWEQFFPGVPAPAPEKPAALVPALDAADPARIEPEMNLFFARKAKSRLENAAILQQIRRKLTEAGSITQIESFGTCAFLHFGRHLLKLQEVEEGVSPKTIGQIAHAVLANLGPRLLSDSEGNLLEEMEKETARAFAETPMPAAEAVRDLERRRLSRQLAYFLRVERARLKENGFVPRFFEKSFGTEAETLYKLPVAPGFELALRGRIDRVDVAPDGKTAEVIDYKSGMPPQPAEMKAGTSLQLQCYLDVCEKVLGLLPVEGGYLSIRGNRPVWIKQKDLRPRLGEAREHLRRHAEAIATGTVLAAADDQVCEICVFRGICRTDEES